MTDNLPGRLLAAIEETEETERIARLATTGHWTVKPNTYRFDAVLADGGHWVAEVADRDDALHITHNDPQATLRCCAADRRVIERHQADEVGLCKGCHYKNRHVDCPELNDLAEGYGIATGEDA